MEELALHTLKPKSRKRHRRVGRGNASGRGTYSGRGIKGQNARSGGGVRPGFEGGRMPLIRQLPKNRGFKSLQSKAQVVNLSQLEEHFEANAVVNSARLVKRGLINSASQRVKILGQGSLTKKLTVYADAFSKTAEDGIKKLGGTIHLR